MVQKGEIGICIKCSKEFISNHFFRKRCFDCSPKFKQHFVKYPNCLQCGKKLMHYHKSKPYCSEICQLHFELDMYSKRNFGCVINE